MSTPPDVPTPPPADDSVPPPAPAIGSDTAPHRIRVDEQLHSRFSANPESRARVAVRFTTLPDDGELGRLGLAATGANPDVGSVNASQFDELQARSDVMSIVAEPDYELTYLEDPHS